MSESTKESMVTSLFVECDRQAEKPPSIKGSPDKYISMFAVALKHVLPELPEAQDMLDYTVRIKKNNGPFPPSYLFNSLLRHSQRNFMYDQEDDSNYNPYYPFDTQEEWNEQVYGLFSDTEKCRKLANEMMFWNVGSDVETRAAGPKLVANILQKDQVDNPDDPFTILNVGSSVNHTLAMLKSNLYLYPELILLDQNLSRDEDAFVREKIREQLAKKINLGRSVGVDLWPQSDKEWVRYVESCRLYPLEFKDPIKRILYRYLEDVRSNDPNIISSMGDYGELDLDSGPTEKYSEGLTAADLYNTVLFSTSMYQNYPEKRIVMFNNGLRQLKKGGKIVVQDFCKVKEVDEGESPIEKLEFVGPTPEPYVYTTFVYDSLKPELGLQPFIYWNNGRCERMKAAELLVRSVLGEYRQD